MIEQLTGVKGEDLTAIFTALLFVVTALLWWSTRRLVQGADNTSNRQLRAYLSFNPSGVIFTLEQPLDIHQQSIRIQARCRNHGQTPARQIQYIYDVVVLPYPPPLELEFRGPTKRHEANQALAPGGDVDSVFVRDQPLTPDELEDIRAARARIYLRGRATFIDVFDEERYLEFSISIVSSTFLARYLVESLEMQRQTGRLPVLPEGMRYSFQFDFHGRHGYGN